MALCPGSIVRSSICGCRPQDPGSNPGQGAFFIQLRKGNKFHNIVILKETTWIKEKSESFSVTGLLEN